MNASDTARVQNYLRQRFGNKRLSLARRENKDDSADLMLEDEFIGVVFQDDEDGDEYEVGCEDAAEDVDEQRERFEEEVEEGCRGVRRLPYEADARKRPPDSTHPL